MEKIGFIGGGNMAEALIKGIIAENVYTSDNILVSDISADRLTFMANQYKVETTDQNAELASQVDILVLAVKPQNMTEALGSIKGSLKENVLVITIAAGIKTAKIANALGDIPIVRVMPNTPALIAQGASALFANDKAKKILDKAKTIFDAVGEAVIVDSEDLIDAVTAVSGSGPAYFFLLTEEMIKAAVQLGISEDNAKKLVLQTAKGAALLAVKADKNGETTAQLRKKVTSPGGTTEAALKTFTEGKFASLVTAAIKRAHDRSKELSK